MDPPALTDAPPTARATRTPALLRMGRPTTATRPAMRRLLGWSYMVGSATAVVWVALPNQLAIGLPAVLALAAVAWALAVPLVRGSADEIPTGLVDGVLVGGNLVLLPVAIVLEGDPETPLLLFYLWSAPYAFLLLSLRRALMHVAGVALGFGTAIVLLATPTDPLTDHVGVWMAVTASVAAVGFLIRTLLDMVGAESARFTAAFRDAPVPAALTRDGRIVDANAAFTDLVQVAGHTVLGRELTELVPHLTSAGEAPDQPLRTTSGRHVHAVPSRLHDDEVLWQFRDETARIEAEREQGRLRARLVAIDDAIRARLAARLHDDAIQRLAATELRLLQVEARVDAADTREHLGLVVAGLEDSMRALREVLSELHPPRVGDEGLEQALVTWVAAPSAPEIRGLELRLGMRTDGPAAWHEPAYRIITEALSNVARHAGATRTTVTLQPHDGGVHGTVEDNGSGTGDGRASPRPGHLGLSAMTDRAQLAGGWCRVRSTGSGTIVEFWLPTSPTDDD